MGTLRVLLALSVVLGHVNGVHGYQMTGGRFAVQAFFIVSGFYMALILEGPYARVPARLFYENRFLRIFPTYWVVMALTMGWSVLCGLRFGSWSRLQPYVDYWALPVTTLAWLAGTNVLLIGHESAVFLGIEPSNGRLFFTSDFARTNPPLFEFMPVPQAWSLSLELVFYLAAPFLVRGPTALLVTAVAASLSLRAWIYWGLGWDHDPWTYRFLPTEIALFISGSLAFRTYRRLGDLSTFPPWSSWTVTAVVWGLVLAYDLLPGGAGKHWLGLCLLIAVVPLVFHATRESRLDRFVGELSYPIYVVHVLVWIVMSTNALRSWGTVALRTVVVTMVASVLLVLFVSNPIERFRHRRLARARARAAWLCL